MDILKLLVQTTAEVREGPFGTPGWDCMEDIEVAAYVVGEFYDGEVNILSRATTKDVAEDYADIIEPGDVLTMINWPHDSVLCRMMLADGADLEDM